MNFSIDNATEGSFYFRCLLCACIYNHVFLFPPRISWDFFSVLVYINISIENVTEGSMIFSKIFFSRYVCMFFMVHVYKKILFYLFSFNNCVNQEKQ